MSEDSYGRDGWTMEGAGPGCLDELLSSKPIHSPPITVEHGEESKSVIFRELSNDMKQRIMTHAIQHVEDLRRTQEEDGKGAWRDAEQDRDVLIGEERDLRMLQAAMLDPKTGGPAVSLGWLRKRMGTGMQTKLGNCYAAFEQMIDPDGVDEETINAVLDDVKKNVPLDLLMMQYDAILLARSLQYSVNLLKTYETDKSSGTPNGDPG